MYSTTTRHRVASMCAPGTAVGGSWNSAWTKRRSTCKRRWRGSAPTRSPSTRSPSEKVTRSIREPGASWPIWESSACCSPRTRAASASRLSTPPSSSSNSGATSRRAAALDPPRGATRRGCGRRGTTGRRCRRSRDHRPLGGRRARRGDRRALGDQRPRRVRAPHGRPAPAVAPAALGPVDTSRSHHRPRLRRADRLVPPRRRAAHVGDAASAAMAAGISTRALDVAHAYALERQQFGAPIGSFQAVKHILADMYVRSVSGQRDLRRFGSRARTGGQRRHPCRCERQAPLCRRCGRECALPRSRCWAAWASHGTCCPTTC